MGFDSTESMFEDRERLNSELFGVYIDGRNRTDALVEKNNTDHFNLYKYTRDADDDIPITFWFKDVDFDGDKV